MSATTPLARITRRTFGGTGELVISDSPEPLTDAIQAALCGAAWVTTDGNGNVTTSHKFEALPDPIREPFWGESWQHSKSCDGVVSRYTTKEIGTPPNGWHSPALIVTSLLGYGYSKEAYLQEAAKFQGWGFNCMRSRRGNDGKYWELWYLPGYWAAEGSLREFIDVVRGWDGRSPQKPAKHEHEITHEVVRWLCEHARFGALDVTNQRAAMCAD